MTDYTKQIFDMLGVEPEEEFKISTSDKLFKFNKKLDLLLYDDNQLWRIAAPYHFKKILNGEKEIIKIPQPTTEEQLAIDYARACGFKWLAKDKNKTVAAFKEKPQKGTKEWLNPTNDPADWIELYLPISFISWEDEEPLYIGETNE